MQSTQFKADHFYGQQRLQWGWSIWKHRAHFKKTIHQRTQVASCWYLRQLVRRGWTVWILKLRLHLNLLRFYHHLHQRQIHEWFLHSWNVWRYRWQQNIKSYQIWYHQFMKWVIAIWIVSHSKAIQEKKKLKLAKDFFEKQLCETNFCAWVVHTKCRKLHLIHSTQAEKWYQFKKFATVFNFWKKQHHQLILYRTQVSNANQFYKFQLLRSYFYEWYEKRPDWHFLYQFNIIRPKVYFKSTQLRRAFIAWRQHIQSQKQSTWRSQFAKIWKQGGRGVVNQDPILSLSHHQSDPLFSSSSPSTDPSLSTNIRNTVGTVNFIQNPSNRTAGLFSTLNENKVNSLTTTTTTTTSNPILNTGKKRLKPRPLMRLPI
ncbi:hypothetical protein HMI54_011186 [Coelomomyces lativittatus]|nr:hypothetical protein HMI54_011186 [Coelomomyces lativittatus]